MGRGRTGDRRLLGPEEVIVVGLCLAVTLTGSDYVGPLGGWSLGEQKAGRGRPRCPRPRLAMPWRESAEAASTDLHRRALKLREPALLPSWGSQGPLTGNSGGCVQKEVSDVGACWPGARE